MYTSKQPLSGLDSIIPFFLPPGRTPFFIQVLTPPLHKLCDLGDADPYWAKPIMVIIQPSLSVIGSGFLHSTNYHSAFP